MKKQHIAVLMGGWNSEREVSLRSGEAVYKALLELGYKATKIDFDRNIVSKLNEVKPDIVFNALHGRYGEDGRVQGLLDILNIPYTHSGIVASAISMDKVLTGRICSAVGIKTPAFALIKKGDDENNKKIGNGYTLYITCRLGYQLKFFNNRFFFEPSIGLSYWPVRINTPESFKQVENKWPKYFPFEPGFHFGFNF